MKDLVGNTSTLFFDLKTWIIPELSRKGNLTDIIYNLRCYCILQVGKK